MVSAMRKRNTLFKKTGYSAKYRSAHNRVIGLIRRAKTSYFKNMNPRDSKKFWKAVKFLNKQQSTIPTLLQGDQTATSDVEKAELRMLFSVPASTDPTPH